MADTDELKARLQTAEQKHERKQAEAKRTALEQEREAMARARKMVRCYESAVASLRPLGGTIDSMGGQSHPLVNDVMVMNFGFITKVGRVNMSLDHRIGEVVATCYPGEESQQIKVDDSLSHKLRETVVSMLEHVVDS